jgi:hypothetical protein
MLIPEVARLGLPPLMPPSSVDANTQANVGGKKHANKHTSAYVPVIKDGLSLLGLTG